ncbi:hypothetical protein A8135_03720 [Legionella jamestowniensis]|uniref:Tetratricopeptide repeat protein n=1 Tax=Legionella jamestowniensis TaxID=455 RepID=A0ABX2XWB6_9GAMM|nr:tetratricopeptide repeat protein [Legionella jamestowniensis]OCH97216.1 hypothetical protein A8135_03720 [Legionella jamestowniensis]
MRIKSLLFFFLFLFNTYSFAFLGKKISEAPLFNNLGTLNFSVSTKNPLAQRFFEQGLMLYYGFEWGEAIRSFKEATRLDPTCGMCYWGLALALGSKINAPMSGNEYKDARAAIQKAVSLKNYETPHEQGYINALALRFQHPPKKITSAKVTTFSCHTASTTFDKSTPKEILAYSNAMEKLIKKYLNDQHAKALYAWALFETIEWNFWDIQGKINPVTPKIIAILKEVLDKEPLHAGANHYYVHVIETSPTPEEALESANRLQTLVPGSEHLIHMPTHIYMLTGRFHEGSASNLQATAVFNEYNNACRAQGFEPEINYLYFHNYDFLRSTATFEGRKALALSAAQSMVSPPFAAWLANEPSLQWYIPIPSYVKARFGMWKEVLKEAKPPKRYQYALGMWHYAQGMALLHLNNKMAARQELVQLSHIIRQGPNNENLQKNGIHLLKIAKAILQANIADANHDPQSTFHYLQKAMKLQQNMRYHEPPDWYFPVMEILADAYLKWGYPEKAIEYYQQDLKQFPKNGWALYGLAKSLQQLGKTQEANDIFQQFSEAWKYADIVHPVSMFEN